MVEHVQRETLQKKVYKALKEAILKNEYLPGQQLSNEVLAQELGVSTTPVREALAKLHSEGLIKMSRSNRAQVAEITEDDIGEAYEVRKQLEPYAAAKASKKIKKDLDLKNKLKKIKEQINEIDQEIDSATVDSPVYEKYLDVDLQLQGVTTKAVDNSLLTKVLNLVGNHSHRTRSITEASSTSSRIKIIHQNNREHLSIITALLNGDPKKAQEAVKKHLTNAENRASQAISRTIESENMNRDKENLH